VLSKTRSNLTGQQKPTSLEGLESAVISWETVHLAEAREDEEPPSGKSLSGNAKSSLGLDANQRGQKPLNTKRKEITRQPVKTQQIEKN
jgi:hypothetical protein